MTRKKRKLKPIAETRLLRRSLLIIFSASFWYKPFYDFIGLESPIYILKHNEKRRTKAKMRDKRFIAEHRSGPLKKAQHYQLITWACECAENVLHYFGKKIDERLKNALTVAKEWTQGNASVGDARKASLGAIAVANESSDPTAIAVARSVGHAVATAHMADHSIAAALYALKAVKNAGKSIDEERKWQDEQLPSEIKELVLTARKRRKIWTDNETDGKKSGHHNIYITCYKRL